MKFKSILWITTSIGTIITASLFADEKKEKTLKEGEVQRCTRPANLPVIKVEHHWLRTSKNEAGLGPANGGVPADSPAADEVFVDTKIVDHKGQHKEANAKCETVPNVDSECVDKELSNGKVRGKFPFANCQNTAASILKSCEKSTCKASLKENAKAQPKAKPKTKAKKKSKPSRREFRDPIDHREIRDLNRTIREKPMRADNWDRGHRPA